MIQKNDASICPICDRKSSKPCDWLFKIGFHCKCCQAHFKRLTELQELIRQVESLVKTGVQLK